MIFEKNLKKGLTSVYIGDILYIQHIHSAETVKCVSVNDIDILHNTLTSGA